MSTINRYYFGWQHCFYLICIIFLVAIYTFYMEMIGQILSIGQQLFLFNQYNTIPGDANIVLVILGWNNFHFFGNVIEALAGLANVDECPSKCQYTADKNLYLNATVIVFFIRVEHGELPAERLAHQLYTFYLDEPPHLTYDFYRDLPPDFFNLTMSYRRDSDIYFPYDRFVPLSGQCQPDEFWTEEQIMERIANKTKLALLINSHCGMRQRQHFLCCCQFLYLKMSNEKLCSQSDQPSKRDKLVEELHELVNVSLYGDCYGTKCEWGDCYIRELESHYFYLALENNVCKDYVTEKFWNLKHLIVPVVLSRRLFHGLGVPAGSYIAADDFVNGAELANYLTYLSRNHTALLRYFDWTKTFRKTHYHSIRKILSKKYNQGAIIARNATPAPDFNPLCALCELANRQHRQGHPRKTVENIWQWWEGKDVCIPDFVDLWREGKASQAFDEAKWPAGEEERDS